MDTLKPVEELEVLYIAPPGFEPENAHGDDFCEDIRALEGRLVPQGTFKSVLVPTGLKTAFATSHGMKLNTRSGSGYHTPLILSNSTGIIEGSYRGYVGVILRNTYQDNSVVDFVFTTKGERVPLSEVPESVLKNARDFYEEDTVNLGYDKPKTMEDYEIEFEAWERRWHGVDIHGAISGISAKLQRGEMLTKEEADLWTDRNAPQPAIQHRLFVDLVPRGTIYVQEGERIAQIHFQPRVKPIWNKSEDGTLPDSVRGEGGYGSTGTHEKE